ncbi:hypothetical protein, partial [Mycobacterium sp.]|uniref:hypothetical protein n=1 Tax=Mycobacterium sp. TaxID=1785 RepID=UPI003F9AE152
LDKRSVSTVGPRARLEPQYVDGPFGQCELKAKGKRKKTKVLNLHSAHLPVIISEFPAPVNPEPDGRRAARG